MSTASRQMQSARTALVLDQPFFGSLALRLALVEDSTRPTAWTDARSIGYNPKFIATLSHQEVIALLAHEVMHVAAGHPWRKDGREHHKWNVAADYAINDILKDAGFKLPEGGLLDPAYAGKSAEWIYARLPEQDPGDGSAQPGAGGDDVLDAGSGTKGDDGQADGDGAGEDSGMSEADWQQAVQQAANAARGRGQLPAGLNRFATAAAKSKVNWRSVLHRFVQQSAADDYTWRRPNTRYLPGGLYLPSLHSETVGPIAVAIDTSGSIDAVLLGQFEAELKSVVDDVRPSKVHVLYADAKVHRTDTFERGDDIHLDPVGGGGTAFGPTMDAVDAMDEPPVALIYLTDLDGSHRATPPAMPVLWATTGKTTAPYGEIVEIGND